MLYSIMPMNSTKPYPIFLALKGRQCAVAGLGKVGRRKLGGLLEAGAGAVLALDRRPCGQLGAEARTLIADERVRFEARAFEPKDAEASFLVFAATSDAAENSRIAALCRRAKALCNCATDPPGGDFILPATARQGALCAALSTAGQSPLLARQWRIELENWLRPREKLAWLMGRLRAPVLALGNEQSHNSAIFKKIAESPIPAWLENGEAWRCRDWLRAALPAELRADLEAIFAEYDAIFR